ncbi:hypothetical protein [Cellulomonas terrae]|nr:hypothetical protein [Cellulomonas terrae]
MSAGGWVTMVAFWAVVVGLAVWAVSRMFPTQGAGDARTTLDGRLASGEIGPETYRSLVGELDAASTVAKEGYR